MLNDECVDVESRAVGGNRDGGDFAFVLVGQDAGHLECECSVGPACDGNEHAFELVVLAALEDHHVGTLNEITANALATAESYVPGLEETVGNVDDIERALQKLDVHDDNIGEAQRAIGAAIGRMEATATAAQTFRQAVPDSLSIDTKGQHGTAIQWMHAAGLEPGDYHLNYEDGTINIPRKSWDKLIRRDDQSVVDARATANKIKGGEQDETGWLPEGLHSRTSSSFSDPIPGATTLREPLDLSGGPAVASPTDHSGRSPREAAFERQFGEAPSETIEQMSIFGGGGPPEANPEHEKYQELRSHVLEGRADEAIQHRLGDVPEDPAEKADHAEKAERIRDIAGLAHGDDPGTGGGGADLSAEEVQSQVLDHVGSRLADGERPHEIMGDLLSPEVTKNVPDLDAHVAHIQELFPMIDEETGTPV